MTVVKKVNDEKIEKEYDKTTAEKEIKEYKADSKIKVDKCGN